MLGQGLFFIRYKVARKAQLLASSLSLSRADLQVGIDDALARREAIIAKLIGVRLPPLSSVRGPLVPKQAALLAGAVVAKLTGVWLISRMQPQVLCNVALVHGSVVADVAHVRLLFVVTLHVLFQMAFTVRTIPAVPHCTGKRFLETPKNSSALARVRLKVHLQAAFLRRLKIAKLTASRERRHLAELITARAHETTTLWRWHPHPDVCVCECE